ncbi:PAS domain-containing protein [bacterium]|nr:PAS domain-containing protein [bacterium]
MKKPKSFRIQPAAIFVATLILLAMFSVFAWVEYVQSGHDIRSIMEDEGLVLLDALMAGAERSILAFEELETATQSRLLSSAYAVESIDYRAGLSQSLLNDLPDRLGFYHVHVYDASGRHRMSNFADRTAETQEPWSPEPSWLGTFLSGAVDSAVIGFREGRSSESRYAVAVRRRRGGAVVLAADAHDLLNLRREVGPGRFIQEIGGRPGVLYVVLQDTLGIRMASRSVQQMTSIGQDPFLTTLYRTRGQSSRITRFSGEPVFEIAASFSVEKLQLGLFRIGLSMESYRHLLNNARIRLVLIGFSLLLLGIIGFSLMMATQNVKILSESYLQVKTHTGEILQNLIDAVIAVDGGGQITVFNTAAESIYEMPQTAIVGKSVTEFSVPCFDFLRETLRTGQEIKARELECRIQGKLKYLRISTSVIRDTSGIVDAAILVATDFTRQHDLEDRMRRKEKLQAMGALASGVAHEVRNPINAIGMIAQRLRREFKPVADADEYRALTQTMHDEVRRINRIIEQFLVFARPPALQLRPVAMRGWLEETAVLFRSTAASAQVHFEIKIDQDTGLMIDRDQMKQALLNLLKNALDACTAGGRIMLTGSADDRFYRIDIEDTGHGIPESDRDRIFDLYYTTKPEGTGIGLPMVAQIVQAHGGSIEVDSAIEKGSRFRISLPVRVPEN